MRSHALYAHPSESPERLPRTPPPLLPRWAHTSLRSTPHLPRRPVVSVIGPGTSLPKPSVCLPSRLPLFGSCVPSAARRLPVPLRAGRRQRLPACDTGRDGRIVARTASARRPTPCMVALPAADSANGRVAAAGRAPVSAPRFSVGAPLFCRRPVTARFLESFSTRDVLMSLKGGRPHQPAALSGL